MSDELLTGEQIASYNFDAEIPEGFDPEGKGGFRDPPPGLYECELVFDPPGVDKPHGTGIIPNQVFKISGVGEFNLSKWVLQLRVVTGPHAGCTCRDFLPLPTPGQPWPKELANRFANAARSFGDDLQPGRLVPPGFAITEQYFRGRTCLVDIGFQLDAQKQKKQKEDGGYYVGPKYFGYSKVPLGGHVPSTTNAPAPIRDRKSAAAVTAPPDEIEL
jgi:hypothetical protein